MDSYKKKIIALTVASTALGAVILCLLCFWIYYTKYASKPNRKNVQSSGLFPFFSVLFTIFFWGWGVDVKKFHHLICLLCIVLVFFFLLVLFFEWLDPEKGLALAPFLSKFSSIKMVGKKGCVPVIDYKQIEKATGNFKESNILGEGGFGCVYKARLDDNLDVAIKKLNCESQYAEREFEVLMPANNFIHFVAFFYNREFFIKNCVE